MAWTAEGEAGWAWRINTLLLLQCRTPGRPRPAPGHHTTDWTPPPQHSPLLSPSLSSSSFLLFLLLELVEVVEVVLASVGGWRGHWLVLSGLTQLRTTSQPHCSSLQPATSEGQLCLVVR